MREALILTFALIGVVCTVAFIVSLLYIAVVDASYRRTERRLR